MLSLCRQTDGRMDRPTTVKQYVGKGENAGYQHFLLLSKCFQKPFYSEMLKHKVVRLEMNIQLIL